MNELSDKLLTYTNPENTAENTLNMRGPIWLLKQVG